MKVVYRSNALIQLCAKRNLLSRSSVLPKRWESNSRETGFDKGHQASRSTSTSGPPCRSKFNLVGPRDYRSNIRKIIYAKSKDETGQEKYFREQQQELNTWHQDFWEKQNEKFSKSKKAYLQLRARNLETDSNKELADELSKFYRDFLDGNYRVHSRYLSYSFTGIAVGGHISADRTALNISVHVKITLEGLPLTAPSLI